MDNVKKMAKKWLCISIALMVICGIVACLIETDFGHVSMKKLKIETDSGYSMSCYLFIPKTATAKSPAPAVVTSHGYLNNKEMQDANFVELARRGYVVLAVDQPDHGNSDNIPELNVDGVYQGALALSRMPFVDATKIGVTGHSMGGMSCNLAIATDNLNEKPIISAVLLNCADATYVDENKAYANVYGNRNVGIVSAQYDEFFHQRADADGKMLEAPYFIEGPNAQSFLNFGGDPTTGTLETRTSDTLYRQTIDGKEAIRVIYRPAIIHPWSHFSQRSTADTIDYFEAALGAPNKIASNNQVWQIKEAFNLVGLIGFVLFIISFTICMVYTPVFSSLRAEEIAQPLEAKDGRAKKWFWLSLASGALFSMLIYRKVLAFGTSLKVNQTETMGIGLWTVLNGIFAIISMILYYHCYGKKNGFDLVKNGVKISLPKLAKTVLLALIVSVVSYGCVFAADYFFLADFRFWTLAVKSFELDKVGNALQYIWLFLVYYVAMSVSVNSFNYNTIGGGRHGWRNTLILCLVTAFPAFLLPWMQYICYFSTKAMLWPKEAMSILWLFPIGLILLAATFVSRILYKVTKNPYLAGIISAIIITLLTVSNTCTTA